ncbi:probable prolyl 4-hydroxylase 8 [Vicia villosa]|uniref:probable prolyl 4-hydroxylase 8 n=1 Tax=Vicia villosa TaxID=3911 RepID=UPI00273CBDFE|nr:probable prolyl 4-hydroxylase 8 [Vicia villosa]
MGKVHGSLLVPLHGLDGELECRTMTYTLLNQSATKTDNKGWLPITFSYANVGPRKIKEIKEILSGCSYALVDHFELSALLGGREKAPAAFCRKAITSTDKFERWGDGLQTRSLTFIDECVEDVLRVENGELIQVLRYEKNQFYRAHHDYFADIYNLKRGGQRIATLLKYLGDNVKGGETHFPMAGSDECSCGGKMSKGICVKPIKGNSVLFWSMGLDGKSDPESVHGGYLVHSGEKWSYNIISCLCFI